MSLRDKMNAEEWEQKEKEIEATEAAAKKPGPQATPLVQLIKETIARVESGEVGELYFYEKVKFLIEKIC